MCLPDSLILSLPLHLLSSLSLSLFSFLMIVVSTIILPLVAITFGLGGAPPDVFKYMYTYKICYIPLLLFNDFLFLLWLSKITVIIIYSAFIVVSPSPCYSVLLLFIARQCTLHVHKCFYFSLSYTHTHTVLDTYVYVGVLHYPCYCRCVHVLIVLLLLFLQILYLNY